MWTPLHAAAFQEHGKIVMYLLEAGAHPDIPDSEGRTPKDFASASDVIWSHFAAAGCQRTSKKNLVEMGIIRKVEGGALSAEKGSGLGYRVVGTYSRPDSAYAVQRNPFGGHFPNEGDVLADPDDHGRGSLSSGTYQKEKPNFSVWKM
eukprot:m.42752 g.42752  ORF g.42752 m.42752 type:complete len:148 (+) comp33384_c0_seq9:892-1335(+)